MNKILAVAVLSLSLASVASAQNYGDRIVSTTRTPVYENSYHQPQQNCYTVTEPVRTINPIGAVIGGVAGYHIGREADRYSGRYVNRERYYPGRGYYYRDERVRDSRLGRYTGAVAGSMLGANVGYGERSRTVCEPVYGQQESRQYTGDRVIINYQSGMIREYFEPAR